MTQILASTLGPGPFAQVACVPASRFYAVTGLIIATGGDYAAVRVPGGWRVLSLGAVIAGEPASEVTRYTAASILATMRADSSCRLSKRLAEMLASGEKDRTAAPLPSAKG